MKKIIVLLLVLVTGNSIKAQGISVTFANQVNPCNHDGSVDAIVSGGTAPYSYVWRTSQNNSDITVGNSPSLTNATYGLYWLTVTDFNGHIGQGMIYLPPSFSMYTTNSANASCPLNNGSITFQLNGGTPPYNYYWNTGQNFIGQTDSVFTLTNLAPGIYSAVVVDSNGCVYRTLPDTLLNISQFTVGVSSTYDNCNNGTATATVVGTATPPLTYLWNTTPPQTTATATGLSAYSNYEITVMDSNGCTYHRWAGVSSAPNAMQTTLYATNAVCPNNTGAANLSVSGGTPPYTYLWNNGAVTQNISGLAPGRYSVIITDNIGCTREKEVIVSQISNISAFVSTTPTNCSNTGGTASASVNGGTAPFTYLWNNGQTGSVITNLESNYYSVRVTDANGCINSNSNCYGHVPFPSYCQASVSGNVINDLNGDCILNLTDFGMPGQIIRLGNGFYTSTNQYGYYYYSSPNPINYSISEMPDSNWIQICPTSDYIVTSIVNQNLDGNNFYNQPINMQSDVQIYVNGGTAVPGFTYNKYCSVKNNGTIPISGTIEIKCDPREVYLGCANAISYDSVSKTVIIPFNNLPAFGEFNYNILVSLPASVPLGTLLTMTGIANPITGDLTPDNNYDTATVTVVGSYDPNDKSVSPKGIGASGLIPADNTPFEYTVRFQNTGTYYAQTVAITDTLDADLDITSFKLFGASHNVTWKLEGPRVLTFTFNSINLPDSLTNEPGSHGYVSYRINQLPNLVPGTEIKNTAYIYFDYNVPVVTNTTLNTIQQVGIKENQFTHGIIIKPNPAQDKISIVNKTNEICTKIELLDINGRIVYTTTPQGTAVQLPELAAGLYIVSAHYNSGVYKEKLIISK